MGQPTHSYDFSKLDGDIKLELFNSKGDFNTLLGKSIKLDESDLVFSNKGMVINLAGIVGGKSTACSEETQSALIECAYFNPESIIGKAVKHDIHSDASHKFERGVDPLCHEKVLRRFIQIIEDHAEITNLELFKSNNNKYKFLELDINLNKINNILGLNITIDNYISSLSKLGFEIDKKIKVPSYRSDIFHQNDLAEEIARVIGYNNIPVKDFSLIPIAKNNHYSTEEKIKHFLVSNGFSEVINSPFCGDNVINALKIDNPLDSKREYFRTNLTNSLIDNLLYNEKRQKDSIKFFEVSDIYTSEKRINKESRLALIISGRRGHNYIDFSKKLNKEYLINLFSSINIDISDKVEIPWNQK